MTNSTVTYHSLSDHPEWRLPVANAIHDQWGRLMGRTFEKTLERFEPPPSTQVLPYTVVASSGDRPIGVASLRWRDSTDYYPDHGPWICNVFSDPQFRRLGIASRLCLLLFSKARELNLEEIYLATEVGQESLYHHLGFQEVHQYIKGPNPIFVLRLDMKVEGARMYEQVGSPQQ